MSDALCVCYLMLLSRRVCETKVWCARSRRYGSQGEENHGVLAPFRMTSCQLLEVWLSSVSLFACGMDGWMCDKQSGVRAFRAHSQPFNPVAQAGSSLTSRNVEEQVDFLAVWKCDEATNCAIGLKGCPLARPTLRYRFFLCIRTHQCSSLCTKGPTVIHSPIMILSASTVPRVGLFFQRSPLQAYRLV